MSANGGMQGSKRKDQLIKNDIPGDIYVPFSGIKAFETLMQIIVAKENASSGTELEFVTIVWAQIWPIGTSEHAKLCIIWSGAKKSL
jgi:hypothetical protein